MQVPNMLCVTWFSVLILVFAQWVDPTDGWKYYEYDDCADDNLHLFDLYHWQKEAKHQYIDRCNFTFVEICKQKNTRDMLVIGSIFEWNNLTMPATLNIFNKLPYIDAGFIYYRVVIRLEQYPNTTTLDVSVDSKNFQLKLHKSGNVVEYMLPEQIYFDNGTLPQLNVSPGQVQFINASYVMVCLNTDKVNLLCNIVVSGTRVQCYCPADHNGYVLVSCEIVTIWVILAVILIYFTMSKYAPREPEMLLNLVLCLPDQVQYEYLVVFRVGLATDGFDYDSNYIDLLLLSGDEESIGQPLRYSCANLFGQMCAEMHMLIGRTSPLPLISKVQANHCDPLNLLHFQDFVVINLRGQCVLMQEETIDQFITSDPQVFQPLPKEQKSSKLQNVKKENSNRQLSASKTLDSWFPVVSTSDGFVAEKLAVCMVVLGLIALCTMLARIHLHSYNYWKDFGRSMIQFAVCLLAVSVISWLVIATLELLYIFCIGRHYLAESYLRATTHQGPHTFQAVRIVYLVALHLFGIAMFAYTISISHYYKLDYVSALIWSGMTFSTAALNLGSWFMLDPWIIQSLKSAKSHQDFVQMLKAERLAPSQNQKPQSNRSTLFKFAFSSEQSKANLSTASSHIGPKLINPHLLVQTSKSGEEMKLSQLETISHSDLLIKDTESNTKTSRQASELSPDQLKAVLSAKNFIKKVQASKFSSAPLS